MATLYIGNIAEGQYGSATAGWNFSADVANAAVWGETSGDSFYAANSTFIDSTQMGNEAVTWNGAGGTDSIYFGTYMDGTARETAATFNLAQLDTGVSGQKYVLTGTSLGDTFKVVNTDVASASTFSINGGVGTDTLQLAGGDGTTYVMANLTLSNVEFVKGTADTDVVNWKGTGGYSFDLGDAADDQLTLANAATGQDIRLDGTRFQNIEILTGSAYADTLGGSATNETLEGGDGADKLWASGGDDSLTGGVGADTYFFGYGDGKDTISDGNVANAKYDVVYFQGGLGTAAFADLTFAADGEDLKIGVGGTDSLTITGWADATQDANVNAARISKFVASDLTFGLAVGNATVGATSLFGTDSTMPYYILGSSLADVLKAGSTADTLMAGGGNDILQYSAAGAKYDGQAGTDILTATNMTTGVNIVLKDESTKYKNIETLEGSTLGDKLGGTTGADSLSGLAGADSLWGAAGNDSILGGAGADSYWFGTGDGVDTVEAAGTADSKNDAVIFFDKSFYDLSFSRSGAGGTADITVEITGTSDSIVLAGVGTAIDNSNSFDRVNKFITSDFTFGLAVGTSGADNLKGTSIADYILGGDGADVINGYAGVDAIYGQAGTDSIAYSADSWIDGGEGQDTVTAAAKTAGITLELNAAANRISNVEVLVGSNYADKLGGSSSAETLQGGLEADSLWGAGGADSLDGGAGADSYWFSVGDGNDTIASNSYNYLDTVMFYGTGVGNGGITSTIVSGTNLTIGLSTGESLTLTDWASGTSQQKVNKFYFEENGKTYSLAVDGSNNPTWTVIS